MNVLYFYNATQTYTGTVFEHISSFQKYSSHYSFFAHQDQYNNLSINFNCFDAVVVHYTIRLPFDQISDQNATLLSEYKGLKVLLIQDEYDHPHRVWDWIRRLGIRLVFTVVPKDGISLVYPPQEFPGVRFVSVLTGYVPENLPTGLFQPPSKRQLIVGYRGRPLPIRYGNLGLEKVDIGMLVARYCESQKITHDIAWSEEARIYGPKWYEFVSSSRAMLGSESGSNVFDWDGTLATKIQEFRKYNPHSTDNVIYSTLIAPLELPGLMNQISPRVFEAIASHTVLVLFEGSYSGVVTPGEHFISLKKDGSNLEEVFRLLADGSYVDAMAERAYQDIIGSGRYSYQQFVSLVDEEMETSIRLLDFGKSNVVMSCLDSNHQDPVTPITTLPFRAAPPLPAPVFDTCITRLPIHAMPPQPSTDTLMHTIMGSRGLKNFARRMTVYLWSLQPEAMRIFLKPRLKRLLGKN